MKIYLFFMIDFFYNVHYFYISKLILLYIYYNSKCCKKENINFRCLVTLMKSSELGQSTLTCNTR